MTEYIEREAAIKRFNFAVLDCLGMEPTIRAGDIIKALKSIPAADVVPMDFHERCLQIEIQKRMALEKTDMRPVVRGKWNEEQMGWRDGDTAWVCSVCGEPWVLNDGTPQENNMNFCPNCGADMRNADD